MTELKTLEDFHYSGASCSCERCKFCCGTDVSISLDDIRQEAIKWLKAFATGVPLSTFTLQQELGAKKFMMHFFNITEEELQ